MVVEESTLAEIQAAMDAVPKITCSLCGEAKHPQLFTPSQKKMKAPRCRKCMNKPRGIPK
jgi:hypothetical protein